jgi:hypothetical protein
MVGYREGEEVVWESWVGGTLNTAFTFWVADVYPREVHETAVGFAKWCVEEASL